MLRLRDLRHHQHFLVFSWHVPSTSRRGGFFSRMLVHFSYREAGCRSSANLFFTRIGQVTVDNSQKPTPDLLRHRNTVYPRLDSSKYASPELGITWPQLPRT